MMTKNPYPSDVPDDEWEFVAPYLTLLPEDAGTGTLSLGSVQRLADSSCEPEPAFRMIPHDLPSWFLVYQRMPYWLNTGCSEAMVDDLCVVLREAKGRRRKPEAPIVHSRVLQSPPREAGHAGSDEAKRRTGTKVPTVIDLLWCLLASLFTSAHEQALAQVGSLAQAALAVGR